MKKKIIFSLALALVMLFTLAACQKTSKTDFETRYDLVAVTPEEDNSGGDSNDITGPVTISDSPLIPRPERNLPFTPSAPGFDSGNLNVKMIEINQSLSYGFDVDTGEFYAMQNFVSGKETAIFVAFDEPFDTDSQAVLTIEKDGNIVAQLIPAGIPDSNTLLFQPRDMAEVNNWEAGAYRFIFETDGGRAVRTANFFESSKLRVLAVPILANYSGNVVRCNGDWRSSSMMLTATYPIAQADLEYVLGPELDLSADKYDLNTHDGQFLTWQAISNLQTRNRDYTLILGFVRNTMYPPGSRGGVLGYTYGLPSSIIVEGSKDMLSIVPHEIAHCYYLGDEYQGGSLNLELNVAPYQMSGHDIMTSQQVTSYNQNVVGGLDVGLEGSGSIIYEEQRPYWVEGGRLLSQVSSYMGWGGLNDSFEKWTTSEIWNHLYYCLVGQVSSGDGLDFFEEDYWGQCPNCFGGAYSPDFYVGCWNCLEFTKVTGYEFQCSGCGANWTLDDYQDDLYMECSSCRHFIWYNWFEAHNTDKGGTLERSSGRELFIHITGYIDSNGRFFASPWYTYEADRNVVVPSELGEYGVYTYDRSGALLSVSYFNTRSFAQTVTPGGAMYTDPDCSTVDINVAFHDNAARIVIQKGSDVIYSRDVSPNAPTVEFTGLADRQELSNNLRLTWNAYDADGDEMNFEVWYCPSEDVYHNVASNVTGSSTEIDLTTLPGTNSGYFIIYATDGVRTAYAESPRVVVPFKAPMILREQDEIPEYKLTERIDFEAEIYDLQDGWLYGDYFEGDDSNVLWLYEGKTYYHSSELSIFPFEFSPGVYTFTVIATNSAGLTTQRDYSFRILADNSDLPLDWSREEVRRALSYGFMLPLDRLDAPVTRGQIAELTTSTYGLFSYFVSGTDLTAPEPINPWPDYREGVITDSTSINDRWNQFVVVELGLMEAPGGRFNPTGSVTEREAALILYRVAALAIHDEAVISNNVSDDYIIGWFRGIGLFDTDVPDAYNGAERLTNKLTLVRYVRCIEHFAMIYLGPYFD